MKAQSKHILLTGLCLAWLAASAAHAYGIRTVIVSPVAGNPMASGTALLSALAGITTASATNPYLLKIEPGLYHVGTTNVQMKEWVDIEGSGIDVTTIMGTAEAFAFLGVVEGASHSEIRELTIKVDALKEPYIFAIGLSLDDVVDQRVYRVRFLAEGGVVHWGIRAVDSSLHVREVEVYLPERFIPVVYGITVRGTPPGASTLLDSRITVTNGIDAHGLYFAEEGTFQQAERVSIDVHGNRYGVGIFYASTYDGAVVGNAKYSDFDILAQSDGQGEGLVGAFGVYADADADQTFVETRIRTFALDGDSSGIACVSGASCPTRVDNSQIVTDTFGGGPGLAVDNSNDLRIGSSLIEGSTATSTGICAGVYDLAYTFYTAPACP